MARVNIPRNPDELIALAKSIGAKHTADGAGSPLASLNMADFAVKTGTADTQNQASGKAYRDAELATQNRDIALGADRSTQTDSASANAPALKQAAPPDAEPQQVIVSQPSVVSNYIKTFEEESAKDPNYQWKRPINFWGRVVDESNSSVANANVHFVWNVISSDAFPNGTDNADTKTDGNGFFSLLDKKGKRLSVEVSKLGYYTTSSSASSFEYANPYDAFFVPDQGNPVVFHLRKKGEGTSLVQNDKEINVSVGKTVLFPIDEQTTLQIDLLTNAQMWQKQWAARVIVANGGIQPALDEFPFEAPIDGYEQELELNLDTPKPPTWMSLYQGGQFYVKTATGYGRMELRMISGKSFMRVTTYLNPTGSRNLEPK